MLKRLSLLLLAAIGLYAQSSNNGIVATYPQVTAVTVTTVGTTGASVYCYYVVAIYTGGKSSPAGPACLANAIGTLSSTNYDVVSFTAPTSPESAPTGYDILRVAGTANNSNPNLGLSGGNNLYIGSTPPSGTANQAVATNQSASPVNDQSNTLSSYTVATASANAYSVLNGIGGAAPNVETWVSVGGGAAFLVGSSQTSVQSVEGSITDANLATGVVIVSGLTGHQFRVLGATIQPIGGAVATCTDIRVEDSTFANDVFRFLVSGTLSQNVVYNEASASTLVTVGSGTAFGTSFASGVGIGIQSTGSTCGTATSVRYRVFYRVQ